MERHITIEGVDVNVTDEPKFIPGSAKTKKKIDDGIYTDGSHEVISFSRNQDFGKNLSKLCRTISWIRWTTDGKIESLRNIKKRVKEAIWKENF